MIKTIILDIDGVIIGEKIGFNSPYPHPDVLKKLKDIHSKGIPVALCTAKPSFAISEIINRANLNNPHITDGGAVIIDPIDNVIVEKHVIKKELVEEILKVCFANKVYVELYTVNDYIIEEDQVSGTTEKHKHILQADPKVVSSLLGEAQNQEVTKIMPIALDQADRKRVDNLLSVYKNKLSINWGVHPVALPLQFGIITAFGSSKREGAEAVVESLNATFKNVLGIGDSASDWSFIELCGYAATLENGDSQIKNLIRTKGEGNFFIASSVDNNGVLEIFKYFSLG